MNKIMGILIAFLIIFTGVQTIHAEAITNPSVSTSTQAYTFTTTMRYGVTGGEVYQLQQYLVSHGYLVGSIDGNFGKMTYNAVIKFQLANGLKADGIVGLNTRAILNNLLTPPTTSPIKVISPNGGENWISHSTQVISWSDSNTYIAAAKYDLYLQPYLACMYSTPRCMIATVQIVLDRNVSNSSYGWIVGTDINNAEINPGQYKLTVCLSGGSVCDSSDAPFTISKQNVALQCTSSKGNKMSNDQALAIAQRSSCASLGTFTGESYCNANSGGLVSLMMNPYGHPGCGLRCDVSIDTGEAHEGWMCAGAL